MNKAENQSIHTPVSSAGSSLGASIGPALRLLALRSANPRLWPMVLREGIAPLVRLMLEANNTALINRWLKQETNVIFVSSFPRSGNTWMRFMLSDILLQLQGIQTATELQVHPDDLIPILECDSIAQRLTRCPEWALEPPLVFIKTHFSFARLEHIFSGNDARGSAAGSGSHARSQNCRALFLYRAPEDALVSFYHMEACRRGKSIRGVDDFCRKGLSGWMENMNSYLRAADNGFPIFFIPYSNCWKNRSLS